MAKIGHAASVAVKAFGSRKRMQANAALQILLPAHVDGCSDHHGANAAKARLRDDGFQIPRSRFEIVDVN